MRIKNLLGQRFNQLTVIEFAGKDVKLSALWKCLCDCGNIKIIRGYALSSGNNKSCGHLSIEHNQKRGKSHPRYGIPHTRKTKSKMSFSAIGKVASKETREKMSIAKLGNTNRKSFTKLINHSP